MADKLYTVVDGMPSELNLGSGGSLPGIDERVTALEAYQIEQDQALADLEAVIEANKGMLPLGFEYVRLTGQTAYAGGVDYMGQEVTRAMYADLWAWLTENKPDAIISEDEWQTLYSRQNGNVPYYSSGDGSTTFRFPRVVGYFKGAESIDEMGGYAVEGLPNITGEFFLTDNVATNGSATTPKVAGGEGAVRTNTRGTTNTVIASVSSIVSGSKSDRVTIDASLSSIIYGNSSHVTPETMAVVMGVIAFGKAVSIGEVTEEGIVAELGEHGVRLERLEASILDAIPTGFVLPFGGNSIPYDGWILCNGAAVSRVTYAKLFSIIGTNFGAGDGSTTFNLPNTSGRFIEGINGVSGIYRGAGLPNITGQFKVDFGYAESGYALTYSNGAFAADITGLKGSGASNNCCGIYGFNAARSSGIYGASSTVQPPSVTMRYYIKY